MSVKENTHSTVTDFNLCPPSSRIRRDAGPSGKKSLARQGIKTRSPVYMASALTTELLFFTLWEMWFCPSVILKTILYYFSVRYPCPKAYLDLLLVFKGDPPANYTVSDTCVFTAVLLCIMTYRIKISIIFYYDIQINIIVAHDIQISIIVNYYKHISILHVN